MIADGLYHVTNQSFSAGFMIYQGRVVWCAPILRRNLAHWMKQAHRIGPSTGPLASA